MKLTKQKKQHLVLVIMLTLVVCAGLWFGLIQYLDRRYADTVAKVEQSKKRQADVHRLISMREHITAELEANQGKLAEIEASFAEGDLYSWFILKLREFQLPYHVDTPQISREVLGEVNVLPDFPYKQAIYSVRGSGYYQDLGKFIADFENRFPYFRIVNLQVESDPLAAAAENEKLDFKLDIATLVKPANAVASK